MFEGVPLFCGKNELDQMNCIIEVKSMPPRSMIVIADRRTTFFDEDYQPLESLNSKGKPREIGSKELGRLMETDSKDFVDFIDRCLEWKPEKRLTPQ